MSKELKVAAKPMAAEPKAAKPKAAKPKAAKPKAAKPEAAEPKAAEPEAASPEPDPKGASRVLQNGLTRQPGDQQKPYKGMQFWWGDGAESALTVEVVECLENG